MTLDDALQIFRQYDRLENPTEEDGFLYTEALDYLIRKTGDTDYMVHLGSFYYERRDFDLALKYYQMAADGGNLSAVIGLGYIWYYGRTGKKDYQKAYEYYELARQMGSLTAAYKVADMIREGYAVPRDPARYKALIEDLYRRVRTGRSPFEPIPEIFTRLARIRAEEGKTREALRLYDRAREVLTQRIRLHPFFGDLTIMKWLIRDVYRLRPFDPAFFGLYDLFHVLEQPARVRFACGDAVHEVEAAEEEGGLAIRFDRTWYRTADDFFQRAEADGRLLTACPDSLRDFRLI